MEEGVNCLGVKLHHVDLLLEESLVVLAAALKPVVFLPSLHFPQAHSMKMVTK